MRKEIWIKRKLVDGLFYIHRNHVSIYFDEIEITSCQIILRENNSINAILYKARVTIKEADD